MEAHSLHDIMQERSRRSRVRRFLTLPRSLTQKIVTGHDDCTIPRQVDRVSFELSFRLSPIAMFHENKNTR